MNTRNDRITEPSMGMVATVLSGLRVVLTATAALALMLTALLFGVVLGGFALLWKILGGRRGRVVSFAWRGGQKQSRPAAWQRDVIDVEVREVATREGTPHEPHVPPH